MDVFDCLPVPYGLIRTGVAPDHQSIKGVSRRYEKTALTENVRFVGNIAIGRDVQIAELQQAVVELSEAVENGGGEVSDDVKQRIETLENRIDEQERMVRHVLTMMIEWMESGQSRAAA